MWRFNEESGYWVFDGYTELYFYQRRIHEYPLTLHLEKLNLSITEAAICTAQRCDREDFKEWKSTRPSEQN